jgi:prepilin-type N-terminal cleavage/methylation domain-containing protein
MKISSLQLVPSKKILDSARRLKAGFTLIEIMVALFIASIVLAAIYGVYAIQTRSYTTQNVAAEVQQVARAAVTYMAEEIMMAGLDPTGMTSAGIEEATDKTMHFTLDYDMDGGLATDNIENITYSWSGTPGDPMTHNGDTFVDNVTALNFEYLNSDGQTLSSPNANRSDIRTVVFSITVEELAGRDGTVKRTYSTTARCRNLGL